MVLKAVVLLLACLMFVAMSAHVKIGNWDPIKKVWSGYNPACDNQCTKAQGEICGDNVRQCCTKDNCNKKLGFKICKKVVENF